MEKRPRKTSPSMSTTASQRLTMEGLDLPEKPEKHARIPADLAEVGDKSLMTLFTQLVSWAEFLNSRLALAEIDEAEAENTFKVAEAKALATSDASTVTEAKAEVRLEREVAEAHDDYAAATAYRKLIRTMYENADRRASLVSRELTRRVGRDGNERRERRWSP